MAAICPATYRSALGSCQSSSAPMLMTCVIRSLMVRRPGLDEVFQTLSGRTLRDDVDADALSRPLYFGEVR